jgi:hypothetical protein
VIILLKIVYYLYKKVIKYQIIKKLVTKKLIVKKIWIRKIWNLPRRQLDNWRWDIDSIIE